ncbi:lymphocyte activation gene 3 protein [Rhineura floridana]|uniref:lymphocyte activation gene 3 protein n=1 Tax=Rhineura floridana TaxID=261503 RepID=UPI002AC825A5|nr:lymphocyte activation gene 3 protein [Rhineura floridana]
MPLSLVLLFWTVALNLQLTNARNVPSATGEVCRVWAEEGGRAVLPCHLSLQKLESSSKQLYKGLALRWVRHGDSSYKKRQWVLMVDPSGLKKWGHSTMHRATVSDTGFLHGNFSLRIEPLLKEDAGTYEALVKYGGEVWQCQLELGVMSVTANPPGPLIESEPIRLTSSSTRSESPQNIRWFHAGHLIPTSGRFCSLDQTLFISRSVRSDSGPWVCELTFADGERISATYNLQVIGFAEPIVSVVYTAAGSDAHLPCILNYNPMDYGISTVAAHWSYAPRRELKATATFSKGRKRNFTLHLPAVGPDDAGQYTCEITIEGTTITKNVTLAIMTVTPSIEGTVTEGSHLLLTCNLSYHTEKERFEWKWLGLVPTNSSWPEATSRSFGVLSQGSTLEFSQVSPNDAGIWECNVHGPDGMSGSVQHHLEIAGAQTALVQHRTAEKITFGLILFLLILVFSILSLTLLKRRIHARNFPALDDRMTASALSWKGVKDGDQEEKVLQI